MVGAVARLAGREDNERFICHPTGCPVGVPAFVLCRGSRLVCLFRPRGFVPLSFSYPDVRGFYALGYESSTHVPVCEARPVQRGYANRSSDGGCVAVRSGGVI